MKLVVHPLTGKFTSLGSIKSDHKMETIYDSNNELYGEFKEPQYNKLDFHFFWIY